MSLLNIVTSPGYKCPTCNYRCSPTSVKDGKYQIKLDFYKSRTCTCASVCTKYKSHITHKNIEHSFWKITLECHNISFSNEKELKALPRHQIICQTNFQMGQLFDIENPREFREKFCPPFEINRPMFGA